MVNTGRKRDDIMSNGKITKTQEYAILWLNSQSHKYTDIAKELKISVKNIEKLFEDIKISGIDNPPINTMITHTSGKKINSVAIMTQTASEIVDDNRKKHINTSRLSEKNIFRPKS